MKWTRQTGPTDLLSYTIYVIYQSRHKNNDILWHMISHKTTTECNVYIYMSLYFIIGFLYTSSDIIRSCRYMSVILFMTYLWHFHRVSYVIKLLQVKNAAKSTVLMLQKCYAPKKWMPKCPREKEVAFNTTCAMIRV